MIKKTLWVSGILAAIAVLIPGSVVLGLYLGILPGLILAVAPTIFLYMAAFALLRNVLRRGLPTRGRLAINAAAAALTVAAGFALAAPAALDGQRAVAAATRNDVTPPQPLSIEGDVLPEEKALLADRTLRLRSSALVARLSDQGARAVPLLLNLLNEDVRVPSWAKRQWILADIRRAFSRLGPDAATALTTVERLFDLPQSPLTNSWNDADAWRVAMVRMGKPVDTLTFPAHLSPEIVAREREHIRKQAEKGPEL